MGTKRINSLDLLKGIAMLLVASAHFQEVIDAPNHLVELFTNLGARGPQIFFVISGYLAWRSYQKVINGKCKPMSFIKSRFLRIAPVYYIVLAMILAFFVINRGFGYLSNETCLNYFLHFTFLSGFCPEWINSIMGGEWYIAKLMLFFLFVPLLSKVIVDKYSSFVALVVSLLVSGLSLYFFNHSMAGLIERDAYFEMYFHTYNFLIQLPVLLMGVCIYYILKEDASIQQNYLRYGTIVVVVFIGCFLLFHLNKRLVSSSSIAGLISAIIVLWMLSKQLSFDNILYRPIINVGVSSYGFYCIHVSVIRVIGHFIPSTSSVVLWILLFFVVLFLSYILGKTLESLATRIIKS